jgi:hypothetical protein
MARTSPNQFQIFLMEKKCITWKQSLNIEDEEDLINI